MYFFFLNGNKYIFRVIFYDENVDFLFVGKNEVFYFVLDFDFVDSDMLDFSELIKKKSLRIIIFKVKKLRVYF